MKTLQSPLHSSDRHNLLRAGHPTVAQNLIGVLKQMSRDAGVGLENVVIEGSGSELYVHTGWVNSDVTSGHKDATTEILLKNSDRKNLKPISNPTVASILIGILKKTAREAKVSLADVVIEGSGLELYVHTGWTHANDASRSLLTDAIESNDFTFNTHEINALIALSQAHGRRTKARKEARAAKSNYDTAHSDVRMFGMYDDCGPEYERDYHAAKAVFNSAVPEEMEAEKAYKAMRDKTMNMFPRLEGIIRDRLMQENAEPSPVAAGNGLRP